MTENPSLWWDWKAEYSKLEAANVGLRSALADIEKQTRGLSTGERKAYLLLTVERVRDIARNALASEGKSGST